MKKIDFDKEWCVEHVDGAPFFTLPMALGFPTSFLPQFEYDFSMCYYKDMVLDYCTHVEMQMKITNAIIAKHLEDGKYFEKLIAKWNLGLVDLRRKYDDLMALDLGTLGDEELVKVYTDFFEYLTFKLYFPGLLDAFMFGADKLLFEKLGKYCSNVQEVFEVLTKPVNESFLKEYNDELIEIKKDISLIDKHIAKYRWINSNYCGSKPYCKDEVLNAIKGDLSSNELDITENIKKKKELIEKYKFDDEIKAIVKLTEMFVKWQDDRKLRTLMHSSFAQKYLDEVSRRSKVDVDLLKYAKYDEIKDVLNGKLDVDVLSERKKGVMWVYRKEGVEMIIGDEAKNMFEKASKVNVKGDEVDGFCASPGKAVGNVKVVLKVEDADDFEEGDVLVIGMTRPEHIVAMKKSAAIVTDDGGITCHAAIVSRELGKPCVIGTKVATKVFKDGDKVEVDADNGKVKKV